MSQWPLSASATKTGLEGDRIYFSSLASDPVDHDAGQTDPGVDETRPTRLDYSQTDFSPMFSSSPICSGLVLVKMPDSNGDCTRKKPRHHQARIVEYSPTFSMQPSAKEILRCAMSK